MLQMVPIDLTGGYNPSRFPFANNQGLYNWYVISDADENILVPTPGFATVAKIIPEGTSRAIFRIQSLGQIVMVINDGVYLINEKNYELIGNLETSNGLVTIASGFTETGTEIGFCDGVKIYTYRTIDGSFEAVTTDFQPQYLTFQDTYFIATAQNSNRIYISDNNDGRTWGANNFTTVDNNTLACLSYEEKLFVWGQAKVYIFYNTGQASFPFQQDITRSFSYGLLSASSLASAFGMMVWLGVNNEASPVILMSDGGTPSPISTEGIDHLIDNLSHPEQCDSFMYQQDGHTFYQINWYNPSDNISLLYDFTSQKLTRVGNKNLGVHAVKAVARLNKTQYAITRLTGNLYDFSVNYFTDDGVVTPRIVISQNFSKKTLNLNAPTDTPFTVQCFGVTADQGTQTEPVKIQLALSHDRGVSFKSIKEKYFSTIGKIAQLMNFYYLGSSKFWTFKLTVWSSGKTVIKGAGFAEVVS